MTDWNEVRIKDIAADKPNAIAMGPFGSRITKDNFVDQGVPVIRGGNISQGRFYPHDFVYLTEGKADELKSSNAFPDDLVFTHRGTLGQVGIIPRNLFPRYVVSQSQMKLTCNPAKANPQFMYFYFLAVGNKDLLTHTAGSGVPAIAQPTATLRNLKIRIPPLPVQQKIAAILSAYNDLIEKNTRRIALLEKAAEEIYREWFVRMRFPGWEQAKFVKGVPEGWNVVKLGDIVELAYGKSLTGDTRESGRFPVFGSGGIVGMHNHALVRGPGIIVGRKGSIGSIHWSEDDFFPIDTVYYVKSKLSFRFLFYLLQKMNFINNDAAVPGLNRNQAYSNKLYLPPVNLIHKFDQITESLFGQKRNLEKQNEKFKQTRDLLLPRLISGKLAVENLDIRFPPGMSAEAECRR